MGRWHLFRDEEQFRLVVNEVKNRQQNKESVITLWQHDTRELHSATKTPYLDSHIDDSNSNEYALILDKDEGTELTTATNRERKYKGSLEILCF